MLSQTSKTRLSILIVLMTLSPIAWSAEWRFDNVDRVVAMADIHGAYDAMTEHSRKRMCLMRT